jgi:hypothetical protein
MYCRKCGALNDDNAIKCLTCGEPLGPALAPRPSVTLPSATKVSNHLVWAILATIFCCVPFGIAAVVYAAQVDGKLAAGDYAAAVATARKARNWCWAAFGVGLAGWLVYAGLVFFGAVTGVFFD